uniref:WGS project CAEQ00000000 data, annotated contig 634 n=1 Tax=Trypanosoma congolense (strain IL3000) TaxID=1068625 RepID=F9WHE3_TRYCI|nr:unnamed protein product [Trypanosoma congolense IL3000]
MKFICVDTIPPRYVCANRGTYREVWPWLLSKRVPAARELARWVARRGGAVHCALQLRLHRGRGCCLVAKRPIRPGASLVSLPAPLTISASMQDNSVENVVNRLGPVEELAMTVARELHNPYSDHRPYVEFLHDVYNSNSADALTAGNALQDELDAMYMGNAVHVNGVHNAPFLSKGSLSSPSQRGEWIRIQHLRRRMEQSLPHFASKSAAWGLSMVLSRALRNADGGCITMYPIIDFSLHSFEPNATMRLTRPECGEDAGIGVRWHDNSQPCAHLIAQRPITAGMAVTVSYSTRPARSQEDVDYWRMKWGFVPN